MLRLDLNEKNGLKSPRSYARNENYERAKTVLAKYTDLPTNQLVIFNGSYHALELIFSSYLKAGSTVLLPVPTFPFYQKFEASRHLRIKKITCTGPDDIPLINKNLNPKINAIYLANPNNPLGYIFNLASLTRLLKKASALKTLVVIDEAYYEFSGITAQSLLRRFSNLIIVRTMSKAFGLPGARIGYIIGAAEIILELEQLKGPPYIISHYGLDLVARLRQRDFGQVKKYTKQINLSKVILTKNLIRVGLKVCSSAANFLIAKVADANMVTAALAKRGILVTNLNHYPDGESLLRNHVRITLPNVN